MVNNKVSREIKKKKCFRIICHCSTEKDECKLITGMHREGVRPNWRSGNEIQEDFFGEGDLELESKGIVSCA